MGGCTVPQLCFGIASASAFRAPRCDDNGGGRGDYAIYPRRPNGRRSRGGGRTDDQNQAPIRIFLIFPGVQLLNHWKNATHDQQYGKTSFTSFGWNLNRFE